MKKNGMTLAEVLITLSIIGVLSAVLLPAVNHIKPDVNKAKFLKVYDNLAESIKELANNSKLFPACGDVNGVTACFYGYPLFNIDSDISWGFAAGGNGKLCRILAQEFTGNNNNSCNDNYSAFSDNNRQFSFETPTKESFYVTTNRNAANTTYTTQIVFDIDGNDTGVNCMYSNNCQKPDTFMIWVTASGQIYPGDKATEYYLRTRKNNKLKGLDIKDKNNAIPAPTLAQSKITITAYNGGNGSAGGGSNLGNGGGTGGGGGSNQGGGSSSGGGNPGGGTLGDGITTNHSDPAIANGVGNGIDLSNSQQDLGYSANEAFEGTNVRDTNLQQFNANGVVPSIAH